MRATMLSGGQYPYEQIHGAQFAAATSIAAIVTKRAFEWLIFLDFLRGLQQRPTLSPR